MRLVRSPDTLRANCGKKDILRYFHFHIFCFPFKPPENYNGVIVYDVRLRLVVKLGRFDKIIRVVRFCDIHPSWTLIWKGIRKLIWKGIRKLYGRPGSLHLLFWPLSHQWVLFFPEVWNWNQNSSFISDMNFVTSICVYIDWTWRTEKFQFRQLRKLLWC